MAEDKYSDPSWWKAEINPECQAIVDYLASQDRYSGTSMDQIRDNHKKTSAVLCGSAEFPGTIEDRTLDFPERKGAEVRVYTPSELEKDPTIVVHFHGGGYALGGLYAGDTFCRMMAPLFKGIVISTTYRMAPEVKWPTMYYDSKDIMEVILKDKTAWGGTEKSRVGIMGDSAGGTTVVLLGSEFGGKGIDFQIPIYPSVRPREEVLSRQRLPEGPILTKELIEWFFKLQLPEDGIDRLRPIEHEGIGNSPPSLIILPQLDPIRDDGAKYAAVLRGKSVWCKVVEVKGAIHGFLTWQGYCQKTCQNIYPKMAEFIRKFQYASDDQYPTKKDLQFEWLQQPHVFIEAFNE